MSVRQQGKPEPNSVIVFDVESGKETWSLKNRTAVNWFAFAPDAKSLFTFDFGASGWQSLRWNLRTGKSYDDWPADAEFLDVSPEDCFAFSPDQRLLAIGQAEGIIRIWNLQTKREIHASDARIRGARTLGFSPEGQRVVAGIGGSVWDANTGRLVRAKKGPSWGMLSADGQFAYSWNNQKIRGYYRIDPTTGDRGKDLKVPARTWPQGWAVGPDGHWYGLNVTSAQPRVWDAESGQRLTWDAAREKSELWKAPFATDNKTLIDWYGPRLTAFDVTTLKQSFVWDYEAKGLARIANKEEVVNEASISPNSKMIAIRVEANGIPGERILLCEIPSGKILHTFRFLKGGASAVRFSPNSKLLAAGSEAPDFPVCVWDVKSGEKLHSFAGHRGQVQSLAFRKDGKRLASGSADATVLIWDLAGK